MKIKKTSKIMALVLAVTMVLALMPVMMVSAEVVPVLSIGIITMSEPVDGVLTFTVPYEATEVDQVTVLAVIGSGDTAPDATDANIAYIDQQVSTIVIGTPPVTGFEFKVDTSRFTVTDNKIFIKIGGTAIDTAKPGETKTYSPTPVDLFITSDNATITVTTVGATIQAYIGQIHTIALGTTIPTGKIPQAYIDNVAAGTTFYSTERNKYILVLPVGTTATPVFKAVDGPVLAENIIANYGNLNTDAFINTTDKTAINLFIQRPTVAPIRTNIKYLLSADVNGDGQINTTDKTAVNLKIQRGNNFSILTK